MQTKSDTELLRDYAGNQSEAAFGEIVRRYADLVYSAALRQVGVAEQARDVAQTVFADLARKAGSLRANTLLIGWLYRGARLAALEELRNDRRRLERERQAMDLLNSSPEIPHDWGAVHLVLDEAIAHLSTEERDALLLRFFQNKSLAAIGGTLGVSEDAAHENYNISSHPGRCIRRPDRYPTQHLAPIA
jgi:RNA polymerase sigma factor (sigma-70 family)